MFAQRRVQAGTVMQTDLEGPRPEALPPEMGVDGSRGAVRGAAQIQGGVGHDLPVQLLEDDDAVQRSGEEAELVQTSPSGIRQAASEGLSGSGGPLPHLDTLQKAFGPQHDLSGVKAHVGGPAAEAAQAIGAKAYTMGNQVAFKEQPDLKLAAHEAAHVIQRRAGVYPKAEVGQAGDVYEQHADAVAEAVAAGRSAAPLLDQLAGQGGGQSAAEGGEVVQAYVERTMAFGNARVSDTGKSATDCNQILYATDDLIADANSKLATAGKYGSFIKLVKTGNRLKHRNRTLHQVMPQWVQKENAGTHKALNQANQPGGRDSEGQVGGPMALWSDCGRSSRAVTGTDESHPGRAIYRSDGIDKATARSLNPALFSDTIYLDTIPKFIQKPEFQKYLQEGIHYHSGGGQEGRRYIMPTDADHAREMWWALGPKGREEHDAWAGINRYARPQVGDAFTMNTEGGISAFREVGGMTWNFHWAGVCMVDGADTITLENYAVTGEYASSRGVGSSYDFINREWNFCMYGPPSKQGQTFHDQHLASGTHGTIASTFAVRTK